MVNPDSAEYGVQSKCNQNILVIVVHHFAFIAVDSRVTSNKRDIERYPLIFTVTHLICQVLFIFFCREDAGHHSLLYV